MLNRTIGFDEKDLIAKMRWIANCLYSMDIYIRMMEEQGLGLRDNLDWKSTGKTLRIDLERIKLSLKNFGVSEEMKNLNYVDINEHTYEERHLSKIESEYLDSMGKRIVDNED